MKHGRNGLGAIRELAEQYSDRYGKPATDVITGPEAKEVIAVIDEKDATICRLRRLVFDAVSFAACNQEWLDAAYAALVGDIPVNKIVGDVSFGVKVEE